MSLNFESAPATFGERGEWPWRLVLAGHSDFLYMFRPRCTGSSQCTLVFRSKLSLHGGARRSSPTPDETRAISGVWPSRAWSCRDLFVDEHGVALALEGLLNEYLPARRPTQRTAGDQREYQRATNPRTGGHQPEHCQATVLGALLILRLLTSNQGFLRLCPCACVDGTYVNCVFLLGFLDVLWAGDGF